jgi:hypothetical protein
MYAVLFDKTKILSSALQKSVNVFYSCSVCEDGKENLSQLQKKYTNFQ